MTLSGIDGDPTRQLVKVHLNRKNNLPTSFGYDSDGLKTIINVVSNHILMVHATNTNLTSQERNWSDGTIVLAIWGFAKSRP